MQRKSRDIFKSKELKIISSTVNLYGWNPCSFTHIMHTEKFGKKMHLH